MRQRDAGARELPALDPDTGEVLSAGETAAPVALPLRPSRRLHRLAAALAVLSVVAGAGAAYAGSTIASLRRVERAWQTAMALDRQRAAAEERVVAGLRSFGESDEAAVDPIRRLGAGEARRLVGLEAQLREARIIDRGLKRLRDDMVRALQFRRSALTANRLHLDDRELRPLSARLSGHRERWRLQAKAPAGLPRLAEADLALQRLSQFADEPTDTALVGHTDSDLVVVDIDASQVRRRPTPGIDAVFAWRDLAVVSADSQVSAHPLDVAQPPRWSVPGTSAFPAVEPDLIWVGGPEGVRSVDLQGVTVSGPVPVPRHRDATLVRDALDAVGVPAVVNGAGSVFATPIAGEWLRLLQALERPTAATPAHAAALSVFLGWTAEQVATAGDAAWEELHARLHRWAGVLRRRGVASLLETVTLAEGLPGRMLAQVDGERRLTDLRHVAQLLHAEATSEQLGVTALTGWLRQRIAEAGEDREAEDRARRLESDAEAVQVMTVHRSKGLEFPVVYCPYLWHPGWIPTDEPPVYHDERAGDRRAIDVGSSGQGRSWRKHVEERRGEELRLAYVALTRARHQAVVWWAGSWDSRDSALCRLLFFRDEHGNVAVDGDEPPGDGEAEATFRQLAERAPGCVSVERSDGGDGTVWAGEPQPPASLAARRFGRRLDTQWRRTSYSGITAGAHDQRVASEAEDTVVSDEEVLAPPRAAGDDAGGAGQAPAPAPAGTGDEARLRAVPSLLGAMPGGAEVGTLVHGVLERIDFAAADLDGELIVALDRERARRHVDVGDPAAVAAGLRAAVETPLGPLVGEARLRDVGRADRVDELGFELPLAGGDDPTAEVSIDDVAAVLSEHVPAGDLLAGYAERLGDPSLQHRLRGYLSGSLDLVVRVPGAGGAPRFAVIDYKTNWLGAAGEPLSAWHYRPEALVEAMERAHYPLQALLYTVALHRYLRWRLPGYDPERNLAGALYLFVRGMVGATTPRVGGQPCGVFAWKPPAGLVEALSGLLDRGRPAP
ncbi:MAG: hypothetical protein KY439_08675 [Actinobacteria bacterium]|nr:hypothetical protein [Actinomycetota bacterium]